MTGFCAPGSGLPNVALADCSSVGECYILLVCANDVSNGDERTIFNYMEPVLRRLQCSGRHLASFLHRMVRTGNQFIAVLCSRLQGVELLDLSSIGRRHFTTSLTDERLRLLARMMAERLRSCGRAPRRPTPTTSFTASISRKVQANCDTFTDAVRGTASDSASRPAFNTQTDHKHTNNK